MINSSYNKQKEDNLWKYGAGIFFISGPTNTGKSTICKMVANNLDMYFCDDFKPHVSGNGIKQLFSRFNPNDKGILPCF